MSIRSKIAKGLDFITGSASTRYVLNQMISEYGTITDLDIDRIHKSIKLSFRLKGEIPTIRINIDKYTITNASGGALISIEQASSEKQWMDAVLKNFVIGRQYTIQKEQSDILGDFL